jgi:hypothetical protein
MAIEKQYREIVGAASKAAGLIGVPGAFLFGLDVSVVGGIWAAMVVALGAKSNHKIDKVFAFKLATGVLAGTAAYVGGSKIAMSLLHLMPGIGSIGAIGVNSTLNYLFTYRLGHAMSKLFDKGGYDEVDVSALITTVLPLVAGIPNLDEIRDMITLTTESVSPKLLTSFKKPELFQTFDEARKS